MVSHRVVAQPQSDRVMRIQQKSGKRQVSHQERKYQPEPFPLNVTHRVTIIGRQKHERSPGSDRRKALLLVILGMGLILTRYSSTERQSKVRRRAVGRMRPSHRSSSSIRGKDMEGRSNCTHIHKISPVQSNPNIRTWRRENRHICSPPTMPDRGDSTNTGAMLSQSVYKHKVQSHNDCRRSDQIDSGVCE